jgi:hypothetical protein
VVNSPEFCQHRQAERKGNINTIAKMNVDKRKKQPAATDEAKANDVEYPDEVKP